MTRNYSLYVDELGTTNLLDQQSPYYILSCCSVDQQSKDDLKAQADRIKYKYWGNRFQHVIFHSVDIGHQEGDFSIFQNNHAGLVAFQADLIDFLRTGNYKMLFVLVDKPKAVAQNWRDVTVMRRSADEVTRAFLTLLHVQKAHGHMVIESSAVDRDYYFLKSFNYFLSGGIPQLGITHADIRKILTSISFVTKRNHDIEEQISDLLAYGARLRYLDNLVPGSYEEKIAGVLNTKIFSPPKLASPKKMNFYSQVSPFLVLPK
ncbi:MAG: DUF3800 domain-containing protein [Patescibacteria group bacterium]